MDGNIPTGALNFLPRRDMLGEILWGLSEGFYDRLRGGFVAIFRMFAGYLSDRIHADVLSPRSLVMRNIVLYLSVHNGCTSTIPKQIPSFVSTKFHATQHRICSKTLLT